MQPVYEITGHDLQILLRALRKGKREDIHKLSVSPDGKRGVNFKINENVWTPPIGSVRGEI
jgi:hypothetical protein